MLLFTDYVDTNNDLFELIADSAICLHLYATLGCIL